MDDIQRALAAAWKQIRPRLARDPDELRRRLARRRQSLLQSPPRAWCLAIRASDTRISDETRVPLRPDELPPASVHPSSFLPHPSSPHAPHSLTLDADDLQKLCAPVTIDAPGEPLALVAQKLGVHPNTLTSARIKGIFRTTYLAGLGGYWGHPTPILYCPDPLDPATRNFIMPDPLWSITAGRLGSRIPARLRATLVRVPVFRDLTRDYRDKSQLHPEHPAVDRSFDTRPRKRSQSLPPPEPDPVAYKWKDGQYVGYDWRAAETNPLIKQNYERHQRLLASHRRRNQRRRRVSTAGGSRKFRGWAWLCPDCGRRVNVLFYPLPRLHLLPGKIPRLPRGEMNKLNLPHPPPPHFACIKCHRVRYFTRGSPTTWNQIVCYLSAGLLYGREVQRPAWFPASLTRRTPYTPRLNSTPSRRRPQVERLLLTGLTPVQIAAELRLSIKTICNHTSVLYARAGVRTRRDFLNKHGHNIPPPPRLEIRRRILAGESIERIAVELGCAKSMVYDQRQQLRRRGVKLPDGRTRAAAHTSAR